MAKTVQPPITMTDANSNLRISIFSAACNLKWVYETRLAGLSYTIATQKSPTHSGKTRNQLHFTGHGLMAAVLIPDSYPLTPALRSTRVAIRLNGGEIDLARIQPGPNLAGCRMIYPAHAI